VEDLKPEDKPRVIFNYSRVNKDLLGLYIELSLKVYDNLSNPRYRYLFVVDLKHAYLTIPLYLDNRHFFLFTILGIR